MLWLKFSFATLVLLVICLKGSGADLDQMEGTDLALVIACALVWPVGIFIVSVYFFGRKVVPFVKERML
jgi:hypothetical protein